MARVQEISRALLSRGRRRERARSARTTRARATWSYDALRHGAQDSMIRRNFTVSWGVEVLGLDLLGVVHVRLVAEFLESNTPGQGDLHQHVTREVLAIFGGAGRRE